MGEEVTPLKGKRHTPEQIVRKLREADRLLAEGADIDAVCRHLEVSDRPLLGVSQPVQRALARIVLPGEQFETGKIVLQN